MNENVFNSLENYLNSSSENEEKAYRSLVYRWCYKQLLGLFPLQGNKKDSNYNLLDYWTKIKKELINHGHCVSVELGGDIVIAPVSTITRNLADKLVKLTILLNDEANTELTLYTELGKEEVEKKISSLEKEKGKEEDIKDLKDKLINGFRNFVYWQNDCESTPDLKYIDPLIKDLSNIHSNLRWDRKRSRKQVLIPTLREPDLKSWEKIINSLDKDYVSLITFDDETKPDFTVISPDSKQRDLWEDFYKTFDFLRRMLGITHNTNKKKERHSVPEIELMEEQFLAYQQEKKELLEKSIREFMDKFGGEYNISSFEIKEENNNKEHEE